MTDIKLSKRLAAIAELLPEGCGVADIGTDHGFIPVWLCKRGKNAPIFAADISPEPLRHAAQAAQEHGVTDKITLVLCDGLAAFDGSEAAAIVIAGMGGETTSASPKRALDKKSRPKRYFAAMTKSALMRSGFLKMAISLPVKLWWTTASSTSFSPPLAGRSAPIPKRSFTRGTQRLYPKAPSIPVGWRSFWQKPDAPLRDFPSRAPRIRSGGWRSFPVCFAN